MMRREDMSEGWWIRAVRKITWFFVFFFFFFNHGRRGWLVCGMKHHLLSSFNGQFRHYISLEANFHPCYNWTLMSAHTPHGPGITWWIVKKWGYHHFTCVNLSVLNINELFSLYDKSQRRMVRLVRGHRNELRQVVVVKCCGVCFFLCTPRSH